MVFEKKFEKIPTETSIITLQYQRIEGKRRTSALVKKISWIEENKTNYKN